MGDLISDFFNGLTGQHPQPSARPSAQMPPQRRSHGRQGSRPAKLRNENALRAIENNARTTAKPDNRNFFQQLFGGPSPDRYLAYAPEPEKMTPSLHGNRTAVYDISAHTVHMPDGTRLEAHSGLAGKKDNPLYVHERMQGSTPPHLYQLTRREAPFHGVNALRLNPVGPGTMYGRGGILAHTFMLGPNGDSNGCVSFRNYHAFYDAYQRGEVTHMQVVAGNGADYAENFPQTTPTSQERGRQHRHYHHHHVSRKQPNAKAKRRHIQREFGHA